MLTSLLIANFFIAILIKLYCKLTCGICRCSKHLVGKVVIVTGGNDGIGFETARDLADRGARVILACRSETLATKARESIVELTGNTNVEYQHLDLASLSSVREFAKRINETEEQLDILINNAGIYIGNNMKTEDGLLPTMQINHFGPFLLTNLLLPLLKKSSQSRIINVSSMLHRFAKLDLDNLNMEKATKESYSMDKVYSISKLCNILMTVELRRQLIDTEVTVYSLHPGMVDTKIAKGMEGALFKFFSLFQRFYSKTAWEGAQTTIYLAVTPDVTKHNGGYFSDCHLSSTTPSAQDTDVARKLWEKSESFVDLKLD